jgi:hypothetical protein
MRTEGISLGLSFWVVKLPTPYFQLSTGIATYPDHKAELNQAPSPNTLNIRNRHSEIALRSAISNPGGNNYGTHSLGTFTRN